MARQVHRPTNRRGAADPLDDLGDTMIDPKTLMMLAVGALLLLNGLLGARA
jgi:hypothetical protein